MGKPLDQIKYAKSQTDIVEVIGRFVQLKRDGANYKGMSPFCQERTPSFIVSKSKGIFKCYSSGIGGDVIDFLKRHKGFTYKEALEYLAIEQPDELPEYIAPEPLPISYTDSSLMYATLKGYNHNDFAQFLFSKFGIKSVKALADYRVGTSKYWLGACIFWYQDSKGVRGGKIMSYNPETGKRIKEPTPLITWAHKILKQPDYNLSICLFGEHLLTNPGEVHIFESEKTAIFASLCYPNWVCLASGSLTNLTYDRCKVLEGRNIVLHPDVGAEARWEEKADQLSLLIPGHWECVMLNGEKGYDFCDWIMDNLI
jgi:hypothetical protein